MTLINCLQNRQQDMTPDFFWDIRQWWWWLSCRTDRTLCLEENHCLNLAWFCPCCACFVLRLFSCGEDDLWGGCCGAPCENTDVELLLELWLWGSAHLPVCARVVVKGKWITCQNLFLRFSSQKSDQCVHFWESYCNTSLWCLVGSRKSHFLAFFLTLKTNLQIVACNRRAKCQGIINWHKRN